MTDNENVWETLRHLCGDRKVSFTKCVWCKRGDYKDELCVQCATAHAMQTRSTCNSIKLNEDCDFCNLEDVTVYGQPNGKDACLACAFAASVPATKSAGKS